LKELSAVFVCARAVALEVRFDEPISQALWSRVLPVVKRNTETLQSLVEESASGHAVQLDSQTVVIVVQSDRDRLPQSTRAVLVGLLHELSCEAPLLASIAVGDIEPVPNELHRSYKAARGYMQYRFFTGPGHVHDAESVERHGESDREYATKQEAQLCDAIRLHDRERAVAAIDHFVEQTGVLSYSVARTHMTQLLFSLYREFNTSLRYARSSDRRIYEILNQAHSIEYLDEMREAAVELTDHLMDSLASAQEDRNAAIVHEIMADVEETYVDPGLTLDKYADRAGLSAQYLARVFKMVANASFADYLTGVRLTRAKELLLTSEASASEIQEQVGFVNNSYFFTLFKKHFGCTPGQMRRSADHGSIRSPRTT
jgi:AraC-like DNA-binding protein